MLKTKENFNLLAIKVVGVLTRWSLTRGSNYSVLTCKLLVFWKTGRLWDVVATKGSTVCELQKRETWDKDAISPEVCGVLGKAQEILFKHVLWRHGGHMVSAWPADWWVWVLSLAGDIVLRHLTLAVPFSTQVYKWVYKINGYKFSAGKG